MLNRFKSAYFFPISLTLFITALNKNETFIINHGTDCEVNRICL